MTDLVKSPDPPSNIKIDSPRIKKIIRKDKAPQLPIKIACHNNFSAFSILPSAQTSCNR